MKERPILMSAPMVRALLAGKKTQTRRVVKVPRWAEVNSLEESNFTDCLQAIAKCSGCLAPIFCPYGVPGDRLWVRETFAHVHPLQVANGRFSLPSRSGIPGPPPVQYRVIYRADGEYSRIHFAPSEYPYRTLCIGEECKRDHVHPEESWHGWGSPIFMPRWASRITLEIADVRVQRLQEISAEDARAEGWGVAFGPGHYSRAFDSFWDKIHGAGSWAANPWVWALTFTVVKPQKGSV